MSARSSQEYSWDELKNEFLGELQKMQRCLHRFIDDLTAISGYAQLAQSKTDGSATELDKIIHTVEKSMVMLRTCIARLADFERRYF